MDFETLVTHAEFVRGLARQLVTDDHRADDVAQQTLIAAWTNPPRNEKTIRSWLRTVVQNFARKAVREDSRRSQREEQASETQPVAPQPDDTLEKEILIRSVVNEVFQLDKTYRAVVILRFYENLTSREIADRIGSSPGVVRSQLKRALEELRQGLDHRHEDRRSDWRIGLLPFIMKPPAPRSALSPIALKVGSASLLLLGGSVALVVWVAGGSQPDPPDPTADLANDSAKTAATSVETGTDFPPPAQILSGSATDGSIAEPTDPDPARSVAPGSLRASLRWADEEPAVSIRARITQSPRKEYYELPIRHGHEMSLMSDGQGVVRVDDLAPGDWYLYLDRTQAHARVKITPGETTETELRIPVGCNIEVLTVDDNDDVVEGAEIFLASRFRGQDFGVVVGKTGSDGRFRVRSLSLDGFVGARAPDHAPAEMPHLHLDATVQEISIRLVLPRHGGCIEGTVRDAVGDPIPGATVMLETLKEPKTGRLESGHGGSISCPRRETTDAMGRFRAEGIWTGRIEVLVEANGHPPFLGRVNLAKDSLQDLEVQLEEGVTLTGQVVDPSGRNAPSASVTVDDSANCDFRLPITFETTEDGSFSIRDLPPGSLSVQIFGASGGEVSREFDASAGAEIRWEAVLSTGRQILGRLVDERERPLSGWRVNARAPYRAWKNKDGEARHRARDASAETDSTGRFEISNRMDCEHRLDVFSPDQWSWNPCRQIRGILADGTERIHGIDLKNAPTASITATLIHSGGKPLHPAMVSVSPTNRMHYDGSMPTEPDGSFTVGPLSPGEYELTVRPLYGSSFLLGPHTVTAGTSLDLGVIDLKRCGSFRATVRMENNEPFERPSLRLVGEGMRTLQTTLVFESGVATAADMWPGTYHFCATGYGQTLVGCQGKVVTIEPGEETTLSVVLQPGQKRFMIFDEPEDSPGWTTVMDAEVLDSRGQFLWMRRFGRDRRGRLTTSVHLAPGSYQVKGRTDDGLEALTSIEVTGFKEDVFRIGLRPKK